MSLFVEVIGIGICKTPSNLSSVSYSAFIVSVQQESYQGWTIYRPYQSFVALYEHLRQSIQHSGLIPQLPMIEVNNLQVQHLELCALNVDVWLKNVSSNPVILRSQFMYQFLCMDANLPPPYLEVCWRRDTSNNNSRLNEARDSNYDVMDDMDDIFDKHPSDNFTMEDSTRGNSVDNRGGVWNFVSTTSGLPPTGRPNQQAPYVSNNHSNYGTNPSNGNKRGFEESEDEEDLNDGLDIQTLSYVEAEFLYDKSVDGNLNINMYTGEPEIPLINNTSVMEESMKGSNADQLAPSTNGGKVDQVKTNANSTVPKKPRRKINLDSFHIIKVIGKGSFGKVFLVREKSTKTLYALKVLKKDYIIKKNQVEHTLTERSILGYINHPFIVGLNMAFQSADKLFFVLDYCSGGELFFHLGKIGRFSEDRARFYAAQIILALEYVHSFGVIYRDLKPENVLLDASGNVRLTDFGLSKEGVRNHSTGAFSFCGTPEYIAPEVLLRQGHGRAVDWWSLGALLYEMIAGLPPFYSRNRETMFEKIMNAELTFPPFMTECAKDILSKFLVRDPKLRLGSGDRDAVEVKEHPFFAGIDWIGLSAGRIAAPWTPNVVGSLDTSQFDQEFTSMNPAVSPEVRGAYFGTVDPTFEGFSFVDDAAASLLGQHFASSASSYKYDPHKHEINLFAFLKISPYPLFLKFETYKCANGFVTCGIEELVDCPCSHQQ